MSDNRGSSSGQRSLEMREALEEEARKKGMTDPGMIARYVESKLEQHNFGIHVGSLEFENPEGWGSQS